MWDIKPERAFLFFALFIAVFVLISIFVPELDETKRMILALAVLVSLTQGRERT